MSVSHDGFASLGTILLHVLHKHLGHRAALDISQGDFISNMQHFFFHIASQELQTACGIS